MVNLLEIKVPSFDFINSFKEDLGKGPYKEMIVKVWDKNRKELLLQIWDYFVFLKKKKSIKLINSTKNKISNLLKLKKFKD